LNTSLEFPFYIALGACSGFFGGLLGIGGGGIIVVVLVAMLPFIGIDGPDLAKIAVATALTVVAPTAVSSAWSHLKRKAVEWRALASLTPGVIVGALSGAAIASYIDAMWIVLAFVCFLFYSAWKMAGFSQTSKNRELSLLPELSPLPNVFSLAGKGIGIGAISTLIGIGGGTMTVPLLSRYVQMPRAVGTSSALGVPIAAAGVAGYMMLSTPPECTVHCVGYVYWPAAMAIAGAAILTAPIGARAAHAMPVLALRRVFALLLVAMSCNLAYKALPLMVWFHTATVWAKAVTG
jgi:uncharacterized membrane protein YfcA